MSTGKFMTEEEKLEFYDMFYRMEQETFVGPHDCKNMFAWIYRRGDLQYCSKCEWYEINEDIPTIEYKYADRGVMLYVEDRTSYLLLPYDHLITKEDPSRL